MYFIDGFFWDRCEFGCARYGDEGQILLFIFMKPVSKGTADVPGLRAGPLRLPNLAQLGLYHAAVASSGLSFVNLADIPEPIGYYGYAVEQSLGKDTP